MKLTQSRLFNRLLSNKGYTIDQTILIVAIIAILITLVIVTVGWQLINRAGGTRAGAQLKQVEDANGQFFSAQRVWPHQALTTSTPVNNMAALVNNNVPAASWQANVNQSDLRNLLPGFRVVGAGVTAAVNHNYGNGGAITQQANIMPAAAGVGGDVRLVVQFAGVPLADAMEADRAVDGAEGFNVGRVVYGATACLNNAVNGNVALPGAQAASGNVFVCYAANTVQ